MMIYSFNQDIHYKYIDKMQNCFITRAHVVLLIWTFTTRLNFFFVEDFRVLSLY